MRDKIDAGTYSTMVNAAASISAGVAPKIYTIIINPEATEEQMISALKRAQIYDMVKKLDKGLDSLVGENGVMLSGGQKQRIAIARILLKNSKVIVFDEATSALDNESQALIVKAIDNLKKDHTIIIVAHRLSTIVGADSIVVLENGNILDQGTHNQLFRRCKMYKELYRSEETRLELEEKLEQVES
jgi:ATP-binding cassette subfamily B protein